MRYLQDHGIKFDIASLPGRAILIQLAEKMDSIARIDNLANGSNSSNSRSSHSGNTGA